MTVPLGPDLNRQHLLLAILSPTAVVLLAWTVLQGASPLVRTGVIALLVGALAVLALKLPRRRIWIAYGAASVAVLLPLLVTVSSSLPRDALVMQWFGIAGVAAAVTYLMSTLREQNLRARRLDDLKRSFVALAHHELRTPVSVVHGTLDTLIDDLEGKLTPQQQSLLLAARSSSGALAYLVEMVTQFHDLETAPAADVAPAAPLGSLVHNATLDLHDIFELSGVELEIRLAPDAALSPVPRAYARIVLEQLLRNAAKFNHPGGHAALKAKLEGNHLVLTVRDDGRGIAPEAHESIFDSFYQDGEILSRTVGGIGLGLALAKAAVEHMEGSIELESAPGKGSLFVVRLPRMAPRPGIA